MEGKPIDLSKEEVVTFNILNSTVQSLEAQMQQAAASRADYIKLLELKYSAAFDFATGSLYPLDIPWEEI